jgi:hypothetical protein
MGVGDILNSIREKNALLFYFGTVCFIAGLVCIVLMQTTNQRIMGVSAWLKPMKFYLSIAIFSWSMGFYMQFLDAQAKVSVYNYVLVAGMLIELLIITGQAARGQLSHFNVSTPLNGALFSIMGITIVIVNLWTAYIGYLFFEQSGFDIPMDWVWGIRLGIIISVIFAFQGGIMGGMLRHTVGAEDGGAGIPLVNWSKNNGDLRIAHFFGLHALQIIPLLSMLIARNTMHVIAIATAYTLFVVYTLVQALQGKSLF